MIKKSIPTYWLLILLLGLNFLSVNTAFGGLPNQLMVEDGRPELLFFDAKSGNPLRDATIALEGLGTFRTDSLGVITIPVLKDGVSTFHFSKDGYVSANYEIKFRKGILFFNRFSVCPLMEKGTIRIVLDWGKEPIDLDLHLVRENYYHVSYLTTRVSDGSAQLDRDDKNSFGPETITLSKIDNKAIYNCYVIDYTNQARNNSRILLNSRSVVRIYENNALSKTIPICRSVRNNKWLVFQIVNGAVTFKKCKIKSGWIEDLYFR